MPPADACEKCGRAEQDHTFRETLTCLFGGLPLKNGGVFTSQTADLVVERLFGDEDDEEDGED